MDEKIKEKLLEEVKIFSEKEKIRKNRVQPKKTAKIESSSPKNEFFDYDSTTFIESPLEGISNPLYYEAVKFFNAIAEADGITWNDIIDGRTNLYGYSRSKSTNTISRFRKKGEINFLAFSELVNSSGYTINFTYKNINSSNNDNDVNSELTLKETNTEIEMASADSVINLFSNENKE